MPAGATNLLVAILPFEDNLPDGDEYVMLEIVLAPELNYAIESSWTHCSSRIQKSSPIVDESHSLADP